MKNSQLFIVGLLLVSCASKNVYVLDKNQPIIGNNPSYEQAKQQWDASKLNEKNNFKTIYLIGKKEYTLEKFARKIKNSKKAFTFQSITDKSIIEKMGYPTEKVNRLLVANN